MAIGYTGSDGNQTAFEYTPVDPQEDMMRQAFERSQQAFFPPPPQPRGPTPYWEDPQTYYPQQPRGPDPIEQAKASTAAAYKYIAMRGYQQDLKEGVAAADAFAKWGPMLVADTSFGSAMKAMQPQPQWRFNKETNAYEGGGRPVFGPRPTVEPRFVGAQGNQPAHYVEDGKIKFLPKEGEENIDPLTLSDYKDASADFDRASKVYGDSGEPVEMRKNAVGQMTRAMEKMNMIRKAGGMPPMQAPTWQAAQSAPAPAPQQPSAPPAPISITTQADFDKLPSGAIYLNKGKKYRKP